MNLISLEWGNCRTFKITLNQPIAYISPGLEHIQRKLKPKNGAIPPGSKCYMSEITKHRTVIIITLKLV